MFSRKEQKEIYLKSGTMIKFLHFDFLVLSYRSQHKVENAVDLFQISLLVPEIFEFKKW